MIKKQFILHPFSLQDLGYNWQVKANVTSDLPDLSIHYQVFGDFDKIQIAPASTEATRKDNLWQNTCFEFFLGIVNSPIYWEFNFSPAGNWNVYRFSDYREGMKVEPAFSSFPFQFTRESNHLSLKLKTDLDKIINNSQTIEIAITMVIKDDHDNISYWAIKHQGSEADFHRRDSFVQL
jgi:hypothetical protein